MTTPNPYAPDAGITLPERRVVLAYLAVTGLVLVLMMIAGLLMRLSQAEWITLPPQWFYRVLTLHGVGMVGIAGVAGAGIMWYFLRQYVELSLALAWTTLGLVLLGVTLIILSILAGGFAGAWTFLYPLPAHSQGMWGPRGATGFLGGLLVVGVGFLLFYLDSARAIMKRYGGLGRGLGWPQLFGRNDGNAPPPAVIASTMVLIVNTLGITAGAVVLVMSLINLHVPSVAVDPLLAKNLIYFFGHVFINATIYMAVIAVYHLLPRFTGRPWPSSTKAFLGAWTASTLMVIIVYPHHLLMDYSQPVWLHVTGQVISYTSGLPVLVVTAYGAIVNVHRSGIRWDLTSGLLFLGTFGWAAGIIPAMIDATISVNLVMHNTLWVPGHFHFYLLLGMMAMALGFMNWMARTYGGRAEGPIGLALLWVYGLGGLGLAGMFLLAGRDSVPRRFAVHLEPWVANGRIASLFAVLVLLATTMLVSRFITSLGRAARP